MDEQEAPAPWYVEMKWVQEERLKRGVRVRINLGECDLIHDESEPPGHNKSINGGIAHVLEANGQTGVITVVLGDHYTQFGLYYATMSYGFGLDRSMTTHWRCQPDMDRPVDSGHRYIVAYDHRLPTGQDVGHYAASELELIATANA